MKVTLTAAELMRAAEAGIYRRINAMKSGRQDTYTPQHDLWGLDIEGAAAELAVAKMLDRYWHATDRYPTTLPGDVGTAQVRSTPLDKGSLIVYDTDPDVAAFILVVGLAPRFRIAGWMRAADAKQERYWKASAKRPAFFVPQADLTPLTPDRGTRL